MTETKDDFETWLAEQAEAAHQAIESVHGEARANLYADSAKSESKKDDHAESSEEQEE
ncbi:hypothetical protein [Sciscionella sediminilitoris]|uniref:hypothetical protein n=1 Tax=Sciscionella sediminilitoris TaxID=1445613 RepID=UPI0012E2402F|nr:hypothetical protein [Sciscionella sp. SE31]